MENFLLNYIWDRCKRGIVWFLITVIFTTSELKAEVLNHYHTGTIRIPGVCYGYNVVKGYKAIGTLFPRRCRRVRADYILGYLKLLLLMAIAIGIFLLMAKYIS